MAEEQETIRIASGEGRRYVVAGDLTTVKLTGEETGGAYSVWVDAVAPGSGPPLHVHHREHEAFYILEGEFEFHREGQAPLRATAGDFIHTPKGVPHTYRNAGGAVGRMLGLASPAGIERFYAEIGRRADDLTEPPGMSAEPTPEEIEHLVETAKKYGAEVL